MSNIPYKTNNLIDVLMISIILLQLRVLKYLTSLNVVGVLMCGYRKKEFFKTMESLMPYPAVRYSKGVHLLELV